MIVPHFVVLLVLVLSDPHQVTAKCRFKQGQPDPILLTTCEARCWNRPDKDVCHKVCVRRGIDKPGSCPYDLRYNVNLNITLSPFSTVCMETCSDDSQCPGILKCCRHDCGVSCQSPYNLHNATGLPSVPTDITVRERRRKKSTIIEWKSTEKTVENVIYVLEVRHYTGRHFQADQMSEWSACLKTKRTRIRYPVKPGTWYNFRIAAVNENGTRGYSHRSLNFIFSADPKPPKEPTNMEVGPLWMQNGSLSAELSWSPPHSDLPIQGYNVFWSRRLMGVSDSLLVRRQYISKDQTKFLLQGLEPNSSYFLQIQAIAYYGRQKLKSRKSGKVLNTITIANLTEEIDYGYHSYEQNYLTSMVKKPYWRDGNLKARVTWKPHNKSSRQNDRYNVTWWNTACEDRDFDTVKLHYITRESKYDLHSLQFNCRYNVIVKTLSPKAAKVYQDTIITFATPSCQALKKLHKHVPCTT